MAHLVYVRVSTAVLVCANIVLALCDHVHALPPAYQLIDLGEVTVTGGGALDINESGQVVFNLDGIGYIWTNGALSPPGGLIVNNTSFAISETGHATWTADARAQFWDGSSVTELPTLENGLTAGWDINSIDHIVGTSRRASINQTRGFFWDGNVMTDLGTLPGGRGSRAEGINDAGVIVGASEPMPVRWVGGAIEALPLPDGGIGGIAFDITHSGAIVGLTYTDSEIRPQPTIWQEGVPTVIDTITGLPYGIAYGVNDLGEAVGISRSSASGSERAFVYGDGAVHDLNDLIDEPGWELTRANEINNDSTIVGVGEFNTETHAYILLPIPEPTMTSFVMMGLVVILRRRIL